MDEETMRLYALRYEWLRAQHWSESELAVVVNPKQAIKLGHQAPFGKMLDTMIDRCRAGVDPHDTAH